MEELGNIMPQVFKARGLGGRPPLLPVLVPLWPRVVGKLIAREAQPVAFGEGVLTIAASSTCWVTQLRSLSEEIRRQINGFLGGPVVKELRLRRQKSWETQVPLSLPSGVKDSQPPLLLETARNLWAQTDVKLDRDLAGVVERSFVKYFSRNGKETKRCC